MRTPPTIVNEHERLAALNELRVLDTPPEERFDRIHNTSDHHTKIPKELPQRDVDYHFRNLY